MARRKTRKEAPLRRITLDMCEPRVKLTPDMIPLLRQRIEEAKRQEEEEERLAAIPVHKPHLSPRIKQDPRYWTNSADLHPDVLAYWEKVNPQKPVPEGQSRVKRGPSLSAPVKSIGHGMIKLDNVVLTKYQIEQFWSQVRKTDDPDECWVWTGDCSPSGHGLFRAVYKTRGKSPQKYAHRFAYMLENDQVEGGVHILQRCGLAPCCNPKHLYEGSAEENAENVQSYMDMIDRLSDTDREAIKSSKLGMVELAQKYKVTTGIVWAVKFGKPGARRGKWWEWF